MPLSVDIKPIAETEQHLSAFAESLAAIFAAFVRVWRPKPQAKQNRRSRPAKNLERRP